MLYFIGPTIVKKRYEMKIGILHGAVAMEKAALTLKMMNKLIKQIGYVMNCRMFQIMPLVNSV